MNIFDKITESEFAAIDKYIYKYYNINKDGDLL